MRLFLFLSFLCVQQVANAQQKIILLKPQQVFDGVNMHQNWVVMVRDSSIIYAGEGVLIPKMRIDSIIELPNQTLLPGLIEGHSHLFLHPYNETNWNDQVLK